MTMVREYKPNDLETVVALFNRSIREIASKNYSSAQIAAWAPLYPNLSGWAERLGHSGVFVCERRGQIVGFGRIDAEGLVDLLYVHPEFQRQGVGRELFDKLCSWAERRGIRQLRAEVSISARPFFESMGFRIVKSQSIERRGVSLNNFLMGRTHPDE